MKALTRIISAICSGESQVAEEQLTAVYDELRQLAGRKLAQERPGQTLQATALVHEAWLRLLNENDRQWNDSHHFFCAAATAMRRILVDIARRKKTVKHGGHLHRTQLTDIAPACQVPSDDLLALDEALADLEKEDEEAARFVELRFFVGLGHQESAQAMGLSRRQADGLWAYARAWLHDATEKKLRANGGRKSP